MNVAGCWPARTAAASAVALLIWAVNPEAQANLTLTPLTSFNGVTNGANPKAELVLGTNGSFFGTTYAGGANGVGSVFTLTTDGKVTRIASFNGDNGRNPSAPLVPGRDGNFYGVTSAGGSNDNGTAFKVTAAGQLSTLVSFTGPNGAIPGGGLALGPDGNFYGTTSAGGSGNLGTVFVMDPAGNLTTLCSFTGTNGAKPLGTVVFGTNGYLYGTTAAGGANDNGTVYLMATNGALTNLYLFPGGANGQNPQAGLVQASDGNFYGTTFSGGSSTNPVGTVFRIAPTPTVVTSPPTPGAGGLSTIYSFSVSDGKNPYAPLIQGPDGTLYGTTRFGGAHQDGVMFGITTSGTLTILYSFTGGNDGSQPVAGLTASTNFDFFGLCAAGGKSSAGTVWRLAGSPPFITTQPISQTILSGSNVSFVASVGGASPLTFQWQFNGNSLATRGNVFGANTPILTLSNLVSANAGSYQLIARNAGGAVTSSVAALTITLRPAVTIVSPAQNTLATKQSFTVTGTASASNTNASIQEVFYQFNGGGWLPANPIGGWTKWNAAVTLSPGTNIIQAYAQNGAGLTSVTNSVTFFYGTSMSPLVVLTNGLGTVSPIYKKPLQNWRFYTLTAKPAPGYVFANWTNSVEHTTTNFARLTFLMRSNLVLGATFVPNPYNPVAGIYNGLFFDVNGAVPQNSGFFTLTVTTRGTFSGSLLNGGARYPLTGLIDAITASAYVTVPRKNLTPLSVSLQFNFTNGLNHIDGNVSDGVWNVTLDGDRTVFNAKSNPAPQAGLYTLVIPGRTNSTTSPGGASYGTLTVDKTGKIRLAAVLAEGTRVSQAVSLSKDGQWPLYTSLYAGQGSIFGWLDITNPPAAGHLAGDVVWFKGAVLKDKYYPGGFTNLTTASGSPFNRPAAGQNVLNLGNGAILLDGGNLSQSITNLLSIGPNNKVNDVSAHKLHLTLTPSSGLLKGSLVNPENSKETISFSGVVLQDQNAGYGFFLGTNLSGRVFLGPTP